MCYQHIVVATDLDDGSKVLFEKGAELARTLNAKLSLIHIDTHQATYYSEIGLPAHYYEDDKEVLARAKSALQTLAAKIPDMATDTIAVKDDFIPGLRREISERGIDLFIFGHHQDFWSNLFSSTRQAINSLDIDVLVVPLKT